MQSVRTLQKSRPEVAIQVLRAKFKKRVKISRVFDFFRSSQALGTSWIFSNKNVADRLTTFLLYASNPISSCIGPRTWLHGMKSPVLSVFLSSGRRRCGKEAWNGNLRIGNIQTGQGRGAFKLCVHAVDM